MKKVLVIVSAMMFAGLVQASEMWWTVSTAESEPTWDEARLIANNGFWYGTNVSGTQVDSISKADLTGFDGVVVTDFGNKDYSGYSFYVELYNGGQKVGKSYVSTTQGAATYGDLVTAGAINSGDVFNQDTTSVYSGFSQFGTGDVIPEPTSGVLMALGMMLFGLKRKRV